MQCIECANVFSLDEAESVNESTSSVKCPYCSRWNFIDCPSIFQSYVDQTLEEDEGGKLYDFRTGKLEDEFPVYRSKGRGVKTKITAEEQKEIKKEQIKAIKQLKKDYKRTLGIKD